MITNQKNLIMSVSYISHKGKKILYVDYTKCKSPKETLDVLELVRQEYLKSNEMMITVNDFRDAYASSEFMNKVSELGKQLFTKRTIKSAAVGVAGIKKILVNAYNIFAENKVTLFDTKEEALDWVVK
jgi:hypothetical protein